MIDVSPYIHPFLPEAQRLRRGLRLAGIRETAQWHGDGATRKVR